MRYLPHTKEDIEQMLEKTGLSSIKSLFDCIPDKLKTKNELNLPEPLTEWELDEHMDAIASSINASKKCKYFIGGGSYDHFRPASVNYLVSRSEFATAYTPYQPEVSQGTLQGIYEFQTMITELTGMDVATASHYDCGTALAETLLIALNKKKLQKVAVSSLIHPHHKAILKTYLNPTGYEIIEIPYNKDGLTDFDQVANMGEIAGIAVQSPNFFGNIENMTLAKKTCESKNALFIASFTEGLSLGLLKSPGESGADLVAGEGQSFGLSKSFGGAGLGLIAGTKKQMRNLPGRLIGKTVDTNGKQGYVLTLATREQHIRREKASSNICSNNGLNAMTAAIYLASIGKTGIRKLAQLNHDKAYFLKQKLEKSGFKIPFNSEFFNEFVAIAPAGFEAKRKTLQKDKGIYAGIKLDKYYPELSDHYLFCATETIKKQDIENLIQGVK
jgi:glycine dehydrogenase subunit 1